MRHFVTTLVFFTYAYSDFKLINHVLMRKTNSVSLSLSAAVIVSFLQIFSGTKLVITDLGMETWPAAHASDQLSGKEDS